ncbi:MAG: DNA polymerase III subunit alpha [Bacteroidales bacterium]|nr:DNA polymerase III subunit alpha [Bacteroidales bacterium]MDY6347078.1 DNA polymerase III subunit alpha [Bacteroidales bacterium]
MNKFVHLHVHTHYSVLDGMSSISGLIDRCLETGMNAMAVTDHGVMFGIKEFYDTVSKKNGKTKDTIKELEAKLATLTDEGEREKCQVEIESLRNKIFKPIFGCEAYVARPTATNPDASRLVREHKENLSGYHIILLAKNEQGYHNLCKIVSSGWIDGKYGRPRIDRAILEQYHEGLIVASACLAGEVPRNITNGNYEKAKEAVMWYKGVFGDDYYLEVQRHKTDKPGGDRTVYEQQQIANEGILRLAAETGTKIIATNDVHFVNETDGEAHDRLICISTGKSVADPERMHYTKQEWLKSPEEMNAIFADIPEALENTLEVAGKVEMYDLRHAPIMPEFSIPEDFGTVAEYKAKFTEEDLREEFEAGEDGEGRIAKLGGLEHVYRVKLESDYLRKLTMEGAEKRYGAPVPQDVLERIDFELGVMRNMGFPGYFLIVQDFIKAARDMGISVGPGRGSAAGSVVAYCLRITDVDPLKYDLLFERFLNPDRISLPDIDVDFDDAGRYEILEWITEKYGRERVAHIITYGTMKTKSSLKDVARVHDLPVSDSNRLAKMIPDSLPEDPKTHKPPKVNIKNCLQYVPEFRAEYDKNSNVREIIDYAAQLEGTVRQIGIHACGVIIGADDLTNFAPLSTVEDKKTKENIIVTEYEGAAVEDVGLIKMDFLGLSTLTIIKEALSNIKKRHGVDIDIDNIPLDDELTYDLFCKGDTIGTFQFESPGMQKYLRELQPSTFEDLIAMNALYRPGPMDYIPQFIDRKRGREKIEYDIPVMEKYLKDTYGITVYQEQVMLLSRLLADFTRGESDTLRKAMGKKLKDKLDALKPKFIAGGTNNGHDPKILEKIWADWEKFASYAFNKSHATCYSWVAYQTAYLKAHYRAEFMAANLTNSVDDIKTITAFIEDCQKSGITVKGPDVNESDQTFTVNKDGDIRFGLSALKGVGMSAADSIVAEREANGPYKSILDFFDRINLGSCNKRCLESLAYAGAFDCFGNIHRAQYFISNDKGRNTIDLLIARSSSSKTKTTQIDIFSQAFGDSQDSADESFEFPNCEPWNFYEQLKYEKEVAGFFISGHPLKEYKAVVKSFTNTELSDLNDDTYLQGAYQRAGGTRFVGIVVEVSEGIGRSGKQYGRITLEDENAAWTWFLEGSDYLKYQWVLKQGNRIFVNAAVKQRSWIDKNTKQEKVMYKIDPVQIYMLDEVYEKLCKGVQLQMRLADVSADVAVRLKEQLEKHKGKTPFNVRLFEPNNTFYSDFTNFNTKVNPETLIRDFTLPVDYDFVLESQ